MDQTQINQLGDELYQAMLKREAVSPLTSRGFDISIDDAYHISLRMLQNRLDAGERVIGKKIGVTSKAVQNMLNVHQPDFGYLTDAMVYNSGEAMPISETLMQPRAEGEIAFILKRDLIGPGVTNADVLAATECVMPCFEIVDSRIQDWKIAIQDTVADNASCGVYVIGDQQVNPHAVDLPNLEVTVFKNGNKISSGKGSAVQGNPLTAVAWLANTLGRFGISPKAGEVILSGSLVPLEPVKAGDFMQVSIGGMGTASVRFV